MDGWSLARLLPEDVGALDQLAARAGLSLHAERELTLSHSELWVGRQDEVIVGFALGWFVADELEIVDIAVDPGWLRRGLGRALLTHLLARGRERGAGWAFLEVRAGNVAAQRLYEAAGFYRDGERSQYYGDGEDAWLFRCCLNEPTKTDSR